MALRRVTTYSNTKNGRAAKVYRDSEWQEWRVKHFIKDVHQTEADYHCTDKNEALCAARAFAWATHWASAQSETATTIEHASGCAQAAADESLLPQTIYRNEDSHGWWHTNFLADRLNAAELHATVLPSIFFTTAWRA